MNETVKPSRPIDAPAQNQPLGRRPDVRFGPAGWSYTDWRSVVYPPGGGTSARPVALLTTLFDTIEVNVTFYRDVSAAQLERWCDEVTDNPNFRWCFKLNQRLSHADELPSPRELLSQLARYAPVRDAGRLGALLLQFPWSRRRDERAASTLAGLSSLARDAGWPLVIEVRHGGWAAGAPFPAVACDQPPLRDNLAPDTAFGVALASVLASGAANPAPPLYVRLHGRNAAAWFAPTAGRDERYDYLYGPRELDEWRARLDLAAARLPERSSVYVITNNHFRGQAVVNALQLQRLWSARAPAVPATLRAAYPQQLGDFPVEPWRTSAPRSNTDHDGGAPTLF